MKTTKSDPQGRRPFPWSVAAGSKARLSAHLGVFSSQRQADVLCTVNLCGTCSADFMRGSDVAFKNKAMQYLCLAPLVLVFFRVSPHASVFFSCVDCFLSKKKRLCCQACCHWSIGRQSTTGLDISATTNFSTWFSFTEPAFSRLLPWRVREHAVRIGPHRYSGI